MSNVYRVEEEGYALSYPVEATSITILRGGVLAFWSETKLIRVVNPTVWKRAVLDEQKEENSNV